MDHHPCSSTPPLTRPGPGGPAEGYHGRIDDHGRFLAAPLNIAAYLEEIDRCRPGPVRATTSHRLIGGRHGHSPGETPGGPMSPVPSTRASHPRAPERADAARRLVTVPTVYLCYVDDSGADEVRTLTGLLVEDRSWSALLDRWLTARAELEATWGVGKHTELKANKLAKGRGSFCATPAQDRQFHQPARDTAYRVLLERLGGFTALTVTTVAAGIAQLPLVYAALVAHLDRWAAHHETYVLIVYDGHQGLLAPDQSWDAEVATRHWDSAVRDARPYREVHRGLDLRSRRIVEDVVIHDSRFSQLIQAADLVAYAAFQHDLGAHPHRWPSTLTPTPGPAIAYQELADRWLPGSDQGITWVGP